MGSNIAGEGIIDIKAYGSSSLGLTVVAAAAQAVGIDVGGGSAVTGDGMSARKSNDESTVPSSASWGRLDLGGIV